MHKPVIFVAKLSLVLGYIKWQKIKVYHKGLAKIKLNNQCYK